MGNEREDAGLFGPVAAFLFRLIEGLISRLDQIGRGSGPTRNRAGESHADGHVVALSMRNAEGFDAPSQGFCNLGRTVRGGAGEDDDEFVSTVAGHEISRAVHGA